MKTQHTMMIPKTCRLPKYQLLTVNQQELKLTITGILFSNVCKLLLPFPPLSELFLALIIHSQYCSHNRLNLSPFILRWAWDWGCVGHSISPCSL